MTPPNTMYQIFNENVSNSASKKIESFHVESGLGVLKRLLLELLKLFSMMVGVSKSCVEVSKSVPLLFWQQTKTTKLLKKMNPRPPKNIAASQLLVLSSSFTHGLKTKNIVR